MQENIPSVREILGELVPAIRPLGPLVVAEKFMIGSMVFMVLSVLMAGFGWLHPSAKKILVPSVDLIYIVGVMLFGVTILLNVFIFLLIIFQFAFFSADFLDRKIECEQKVVLRLSETFSQDALDALAARLALEIEYNSIGLSNKIATFVGLGGLIVAANPALSGNVWEMKEALELIVPAVLVAVTVAVLLRQKFSSELGRVKHVVLAARNLQGSNG